MSESDLALFNDSLERCRKHPDFLDRFYAMFLESSETVAAKFAQTDFPRQKLVLAESLYTILSFARRRPVSEPALERIAQIHGRAGYDIRPELYDLWLECLLRSVRECDPLCSEDTESAWRAVLQSAIEFMKERY